MTLPKPTVRAILPCWHGLSPLGRCATIITLIAAGGDLSMRPCLAEPAAKQPSAAATAKPIDLLKLVNPARDSVVGLWKFENKRLVSPDFDRARLQIPMTPPSDYQLTIEGDRTTGVDLGIGLVVGGRQVLLLFNAHFGAVSGLHLVDGRNVADNVTTVRVPKPVADNQPFSIVCTVHPGSVSASLNGRDLIAWQGNASQLSLPDDWLVPQQNRLFLTTYRSHDQFRKITLQALPSLAPAAAPPRSVAPLASSSGGAAGRKSVPSSADRQAAAKVVKDVYGRGIDKSASTAEKCKTVEKILADAATEQDLTARFAMIETAIDLATTAPSVPLMIRAMKQLADQYDVDSPKLLADAFVELGKSKLPKSGWGELADAAATAADDAQAQGRQPEAQRLAKIALAAAKKGRTKDVVAALAAHFDAMQQLSESAEKADAARKILAARPDDAAAHTVLGSYLCFALDKWDEGLDHLARGNDESLSKPAQAERASGRQPAERAKIGDSWYDAAGSAAVANRPAMLRRAVWWYDQARSGATGLTQIKIDKRLEEIRSRLPTVANIRPSADETGYLCDQDLVGLEQLFSYCQFRWLVRHAGKLSPHGLWLHPPADNKPAHAVFKLPDNYRRLTGMAVIEDTSPGVATPVTFVIAVDGKERWRSKKMQVIGDGEEFDINVAGGKRLDVLVDCPGSNHGAHAVLVEPRLIR